jgi:hypothetical protein
MYLNKFLLRIPYLHFSIFFFSVFAFTV